MTEPTVTQARCKTSPFDRFWSRVNFDGPIPAYRPELGKCWLFTGHKTQGYGGLYLSRRFRQVQVHRFSFELAHAREIAEGMTIDHLCRVRDCVNPAHLEEVTMGVNVLRGFSPPAKCARKTHCAKGHPLTDTQKTRHRINRICKICKREWMRVWQLERKKKRERQISG